MVANDAAFDAGDEMMTCTIDCASYSQGRFGYQRKCLEWLRNDHRALGDDDRAAASTTTSPAPAASNFSMTVRLFGHWTCPFVNRVAFALGQRGVDYELVDVPPSAVRPKDFVLPDEFVEHSPRLEVPLGSASMATSWPTRSRSSSSWRIGSMLRRSARQAWPTSSATGWRASMPP